MVSPLFGRVEELVELLVNLVEVSGGFQSMFSFGISARSFWPAKDDAVPTLQRLNKPRKRYHVGVLGFGGILRLLV